MKFTQKAAALVLSGAMVVAFAPAVPAALAEEAPANGVTATQAATATDAAAPTDAAQPAAQNVKLADGTYTVPVKSGYDMFKIADTSTIVIVGDKATVTVTTDGADPESLDAGGNPKYDALYLGKGTDLSKVEDKTTVPVVEGKQTGKSVSFTFDTTQEQLNSGVFFVARYAKTYLNTRDKEAGKTTSASAGTFSGMGQRTGGKITDHALTFDLANAKKVETPTPAPTKKAAKTFAVNAATVNAKAVKAAAKKAGATAKSATSITVGAKAKKISKGAFKGFAKVKTVTVKSTKLTKRGVKGSLSGSKVTTVKVPKSKKAAYKKIFTKANAGKKVTVK